MVGRIILGEEVCEAKQVRENAYRSRRIQGPRDLPLDSLPMSEKSPGPLLDISAEKEREGLHGESRVL